MITFSQILFIVTIAFTSVMLFFYIWRGRNYSYKELHREFSRLDKLVTDWRHADGSLIPAEKRLKIIRQHRKVSRALYEHPDHPRRRAS